MKVLSIIQPWAALIASGEKSIETRSWKTKYTGDLLIHASKKIDKTACGEEHISVALKRHGLCIENLPTGVILAKCTLDKCLSIQYEDGLSALLDGGYTVSGNEYYFGNYHPYRYAWVLLGIEKIKPIPARGRLNLWDFDFE